MSGQQTLLKNESERLAYFDNFKGLLISLVVLGHYLYAYAGTAPLNLAGTITGIIYTFHMPAFAFVSGFFSKSSRSAGARSLFKLLSAYLIFNTLMLLYHYLFVGGAISLLTPMYSNWYLLALVAWRLSAKYFGRQKYLLVFSAAIALLAGFWPEISNIFSVGRIITFFPFFLIGYRIDKNLLPLLARSRKKFVYFLGTILLTGCMAASYYLVKSGIVTLDISLMGAYKSGFQSGARAAVLLLALFYITALLMLIPVKKIPVLAKWGRNSLAIYLAHRLFTLMFTLVFPAPSYSSWVFAAACAASAATLVVLSLDRISLALDKILEAASGALTGANDYKNKARQRALATVAVFALCVMMLNPAALLAGKISQSGKTGNPSDPIYPVLSGKTLESLRSDVKITFSGDLILLMDQVKDGRNKTTGRYNYDPQFEYAKKYFAQADYSIGVFEGPLAGEEAGYTDSNYYDGFPVHLNYPDAFAAAVKKAGIDYVSLANNHLLDKGTKGALRTLDVLDRFQLRHTGSYRNEKEKSTVSVVNVKGLKIAVLSYTYGCNYYTEDYLFDKNPNATSAICDPESKYFSKAKEAVLRDFERARQEKPDIIAVIPHMGAQFVHTTNEYQRTWNDIFIEAGADLILGDHAHAVQPIEYRTAKTVKGDRHSLIINCPGNFVNSYTDYDGDATAIVEIYLHPKTGAVQGCSVIPMMTQGMNNGQYRALPVSDIMNSPALAKTLGKQDVARAKEVQKIVTASMLGCPITYGQLQDRYYFLPDGYHRQKVQPMELTDFDKNSPLYELLSNAKSVCFTGDSLTEGTKNGGYGWYEPMMASFPNVKVIKKAWGGSTSAVLLEHNEELANAAADAYVVAIGTNDVRYRDSKICAMDAQSFIKNVDTLRTAVLEKNKGAVFVFVAPWMSLDSDSVSKLATNEKNAMLAEYTAALKKYCAGNACLFIDPNPVLRKTLAREHNSEYLLDYIHPNTGKGIELYSSAVLSSR